MLQTEAQQSQLGWAVTIGDISHTWSIWSGQQLRKHVAMDAETTVVDGPSVPKLAMVSVSDGQQNYVLRPRDCSGFFEAHLQFRGCFGYEVTWFHHQLSQVIACFEEIWGCALVCLSQGYNAIEFF